MSRRGGAAGRTDRSLRWRGQLARRLAVLIVTALVAAQLAGSWSIAGAQPPPSPASLKAQAGVGSVSLEWTAGTGGTITGYDVYAGTRSNGETLAAQVADATDETYHLAGLTNGQEYYFYVTDVDGSTQSSPSEQAAATPSTSALDYGTGVEYLPYSGGFAAGIAADAAGDLFVANPATSTVDELPAGTSQEIALSFAGLQSIGPVAVDAQGDVYVVDDDNSSQAAVVELQHAGSQVTLPFPPLDEPSLSVNPAGDVAVSTSSGTIYELAPGATTPIELPFERQITQFEPYLVGIDDAGDVYVANTSTYDDLDELPAGSSTAEVLQVPGLEAAAGIAFDSAGDVIVGDFVGGHILELVGGSPSDVVTLGVSTPSYMEDVAVDGAGDVFGSEYFGNVFEVPASSLPVVPESPWAVLLPLLAVAMFAAVGLRQQRRHRRRLTAAGR
ncbi:MAG TPA: fibronectin type III domain-containing protein [Acidimicrobiales bacterium]|nr:fibronectin type III domain-containing protein [Acidimicrobiales bacterium]